jgi:hypothetical protein
VKLGTSHSSFKFSLETQKGTKDFLFGPSQKNILIISVLALVLSTTQVQIPKSGVASPKTRDFLRPFFCPLNAKIPRISGEFWGWHLFC